MKTTTTDPIPEDLSNQQARQAAMDVANVREARARAKAAESYSVLVGVVMVWATIASVALPLVGLVWLVRWIA